MKIIKANAGWAFILFLAISAGLLYFFPHNTPLKAVLLAVSIGMGVMSRFFHLSPPEEIPEDERIFFLKSRTIGISRIAGAFVPIFYYVLSRENVVDFVVLLAGVTQAIAILIEFLYESEYPKQYVYVEGDTIKRKVSGNASVNLKDLKYAILRTGSLIMYEQWAHHRIVFDEFEEGERLKETLLARIKALKIDLKEEPAAGVA